MNVLSVLDQAGLATLLLEGLKYLWRLIIGDPAYNFPQKFYLVMLPVFQVIAAVILAFLGVSGYTYPSDWLEWLKGLVLVLISSLVSVLIYNQGLKPLKEYSKARADAGFEQEIGVVSVPAMDVKPVRKSKK